ncbi:acyltransferase [Serratia sp. M24T3]|uniref:acyltransferase n=1 Tax=Serratia sp. M24T3 TaxID=932213 RepID=UPI00025B91DB|nr:acyltransferase [Serratia sp. M24T3]EIC83030.1 acetyltransferase [Serratia sp. M24T3]
MKIIECSIRDVSSGQNVTLVSPSNLYGCSLNDEVFVGPFVEIQKGCVIGRGSRIQSHSFLCENVITGENCFIGHNVTFANDLFKNGSPDPDSSNWLNIVLGDNVTIGSGSTILCEFICSGSVIGAGSVVTKPTTIKGIYVGNSARLIREL